METAPKNTHDLDSIICNSTDGFRYKEECHHLFHSEDLPRSKIDLIKDVEVQPTQFVIITTKEGPVDSLKIHIELVDLQENRTLPQIDLIGLFLVVTRGRYTIPFLKPSRWYGLSFMSENVINGEMNVHKENRLLRTAELNGTRAHDIYEVRKERNLRCHTVFMHRNLDGEESVERLYITSKWKGKERWEIRALKTTGELHVSVKIHCEFSSTTEQMILHLDEDSLTIEISMDLRYDINHLDDSFHRVVAHIAPLKCHNADSTNGIFHMPLSSDTVYAVQYQYIKLKPFHFSKKEHFLVEVVPGNDSEPLFPLVEVNFDTENRTEGDGHLILTPFVTFIRGELYANRDVHLHLEPFCEQTQTSVWTLNDQKTSYRLNLTSAICTNTLLPEYCLQGIYTNCTPNMCYSTSVVVDGDEYASSARCLNVSQHFSIRASSNQILFFAYLLTVVLFAACI
ncbi:unnamed protein product [Angiostrongylus costaricensis]|uniref:Protein NDNF n=1 Tax=Angiostrongylus costaricensis TaxID=334426 RepID=A0A0R3PYK6_ANGCS|nr:unnamed protein product [Angiostrongylus costaricensis]